MLLNKLRVFVMLFGISATAVTAEVAPAFKLTSADIDRMVALPPGGTAMGTLPVGEHGPKVLVLRRTQNGDVEIHETFNDLFVVRSGEAIVRVGGNVLGNRRISAGEWRGGSIAGGASFLLGPGDVLWIPAGSPHQVMVQAKGDFTYLAFKSAK